MPSSAPCQIMHSLVLVGLGVGRGGVRIRVGVRIRQSGSDFNEGVHNLAGVQKLAQHRHSCVCPRSALVLG